MCLFRRSSRAFTLIETLVCLSGIGILTALLLPAAMSAREAARRLKCSHNLNQVGIALQSYHASNNCFPPDHIAYGYSKGGPPGPMKGPAQFCSAMVRLLPFLEQQATFNSANFDVEFSPESWEVHSANLTAYNTKLASFLCPSDSVVNNIKHGNSYWGNTGVGPSFATSMECPDSGNGFFGYPSTIDSSSFLDGLSHTVAFSERICGTNVTSAQGVPERDFSSLSDYPEACNRDADFALGWCRVASTSTNFPTYRDAGSTWFYAGRISTEYCHAQEPNGRIPDGLLSNFFPFNGISTARSWHHGGVNALMSDGSIRFVGDSINRRVWRGIGTRNGGELVE